MPEGCVCMPFCFGNSSYVCLFQQITDEGLVSLCRGCHKLQILCVSGCSNITDASLTAMGLNCPRLKWERHTRTHVFISLSTGPLLQVLWLMHRQYRIFFKLLLLGLVLPCVSSDPALRQSENIPSAIQHMKDHQMSLCPSLLFPSLLDFLPQMARKKMYLI